MTISTDEKFLLNKMSPVSARVQLGTLIENAENVVEGEITLPNGELLIGNASNVAVSLAISGDITISNAGVSAIGSLKVATAMIQANAVTLAKLASGITPSHVVKFAGKFTTLGGDANEQITATGAVAGDIVIATLQDVGLTPRTLLTAKAGTDVVNLVFSGDPSTDHVVNYQVLRAAS